MLFGRRAAAVLGRVRHVHEIAAKGFAHDAATYERARPTYPSAALELCKRVILGERSVANVVEVGAGTGKFTRALQAADTNRSLNIVAVEPVEAMRAEFLERVKEIPILDGRAEALPIQSRTADAVVFAQAFHWCANEQTMREVHRVLAPSGSLVLIWNLEDRTTKWVADIRNAYEEYEGTSPQYRHGTWREVFDRSSFVRENFGRLQSSSVTMQMPVTLQQIWERALSKSYIAILPEAKKRDLEARIRGLVLKALPQLADPKATVLYPYGTDVFWCERL